MSEPNVRPRSANWLARVNSSHWKKLGQQICRCWRVRMISVYMAKVTLPKWNQLFLRFIVFSFKRIPLCHSRRSQKDIRWQFHTSTAKRLRLELSKVRELLAKVNPLGVFIRLSASLSRWHRFQSLIILKCLSGYKWHSRLNLNSRPSTGSLSLSLSLSLEFSIGPKEVERTVYSEKSTDKVLRGQNSLTRFLPQKAPKKFSKILNFKASSSKTN